MSPQQLLSSIFLSLIFFVNAASAQLQVFTVERNGSSKIFSHIDSALAYAQNGDEIYLPGGLININSVIRKSISIIGVGFHPDSTTATGQTIITSPTLFIKGATNFSMTGIYVQNNCFVDSCNNILISRCRLGALASNEMSFYNSSNISVSSSIANVLISGSLVTPGNSPVLNLLITNSVFYGFIHASNAQLDNNIFLNVGNTSDVFSNFTGYSFKVINSIFRSNVIRNNPNAYVLANNNTFYNNVFADSILFTTAIGQNNQSKKNITTVFQNVSSPATFAASDNFHLKAGSPAIGAGINGTDCGIYGGNNPFKEGGVPYNPHIQSISIPPTTDQNGNLNINIKVSAQSN
jgi:hypothetical protein